MAAWRPSSNFLVLGAQPAESVDQRFARWLATDTLTDAMPRWWAERGDTTSLQTFLARLDALVRRARRRRPDPGEIPRADLEVGIANTRIALAFARGDTARAVAAILAQPDSVCPGCVSVHLFFAQILAANGRLEDAAARLERQRLCCMGILAAPWALERARVNEALGRREVAIESYRYVSDVWANADPGLQPHVTAARDALRRLASEEGGGRR